MSLYTKIIDYQKLLKAWDRVRKNKPAAGVDGVTYEQFEEGKKGEIRQLQSELKDHEYHTLPVKCVKIYRGEKAREIALYSMRDKVVQQSLSEELNRIYDSRLSSQTYAYRPNKSALTGIEEINEQISSGKYDFFLKVDISHYFDTIRWEILQGILLQSIEEQDVLELIRENSCSISLDEITGELEDKREGIYQGSGIAPVLSNIYLMEFDRNMCGTTDIYYLRYSDDIIILGQRRDDMANLLMEIKNVFNGIGLSINERKSVIGEISDGFHFLGYFFDRNGKAVPAKAESSLCDRLEMMWLTSGDIGIEAKLKKVLEIVGGWEQYFREDREITSIFEFAALVYAHGTEEDYRKELSYRRGRQENIYRDIAEYLRSYWRNNKEYEMELLEYEQFYGVPRLHGIMLDDKTIKPFVHELLKGYRSYIIREDYDIALEIMQSYTDLKGYEQAEYWQEQAELLKRRQDKNIEVMMHFNSSENDIIYRSDTVGKMLKLFVGREDIFAKETLDDHRGRKTETDPRPLTENIMKEHLTGKITADTYVQRPNSTVRFIVYDVDISKRILLQYGSDSEAMKGYLQKALDQTVRIKTELSHMGIQSYIEYSGSRGYHLWIFLTEWIPTRYANMLNDIIETKVQKDDDVQIDFYPNKTRIKDGRYGQAIKIPYGIHAKSGKRSYFLDEGGHPVMEIDSFVDGAGKTALSDIKKVLASTADPVEGLEKKEVDSDLSAFGDIEPEITKVLENCNLMRYLCQKSVKTGYLTHFERLTVLYVFGHIGEEGRNFIHKVMSFTLNYKHGVTEHFISKRPEKPVSCVKLRDQYKQQTAEFGCSCVFKKDKNCYPSPVLHAISFSPDTRVQVTLPASRTLSKEKENRVKAEMNIHTKAQELAGKILECKKQRRSIDRDISKLEKELGSIFDAQGIDSLELQIGLLTRRRTDNGVEWVIEI